MNTKKIVIVILIITAIGIFVWLAGWIALPQKAVSPEEKAREQQNLFEQQAKELEELRGEAASPSEEKIVSQLEDLEGRRQTAQPPSAQDLQKQLEELEKLRSSQQ